MFETMLLLIIVLILGLMAIGYAVEVGGIFAWIGWAVVLVCCALFFYASGMYPKIGRKTKADRLDVILPPRWSPKDGERFLRGKRGRP